jgi:hypothetical protein
MVKLRLQNHHTVRGRRPSCCQRAAGASTNGIRLNLDADTPFVASLTVPYVSGGFSSNTRVSRLGCSLIRMASGVDI